MPWKMAMRRESLLAMSWQKGWDFYRRRVNALPASQKGAAGYTPRVKALEVAGIFKTGMYEYDSSLAFVSLPAAREVLGLPAGFLSGIEITVRDLSRADETAIKLSEELGAFLCAHLDGNECQPFAALKLEKSGCSSCLQWW